MIQAVEDHSQAYFAWKEAGIRGGWCWHVDAHLDISRDGLSPARLQALAGGERCTGSPYLPWGGLNCGNYLYAAIREGIVTRLTWVIPPYLAGPHRLKWAREHLDGWFDLTVAESVGLRLEEGVVRGTLLGIPVEVAPAEALTLPTEPVLLDIDLDYFLTGEGELWGEELPTPPARYTTVAYSVLGGYTPTEFRRLARPWVADYGGYAAGPLDRAAGLARVGRHAEALTQLEGLEPGVEATYLAGSSRHHLGEHAQALEAWDALLRGGELPNDGRAYLLGLASESLRLLGRGCEALARSREAQALVEPDYRLHWAAAAALEQMGELAPAARELRRALRLAEPYVFGLKLRLALARLYKQQGKAGLAALELAQLEKADLSGQYRPLTLLR